MMLCEHCSFTISPAHDGQCPRCGATRPKQRTSNWVAVARVNNLAEVGYLADVLEGDGLATQIIQHNDFCAVSGAWRATYMLCVARQDQPAAIELLNADLQQAGEDGWPPAEDSTRRRGSAGAWRSVMLVLMAGGIAYYAGRGGVEQRRPAPLRESLWEALSEYDETFVTETEQESPPGRLHFDRGTRTFILEDNPNGEGDRRVRRYREGRLVEETVHQAQ